MKIDTTPIVYPFSVPVMLPILFYSTAATALSFFLLWPIPGSTRSMLANLQPAMSFIVSAVCFSIQCYFNLSFGNNEISQSDYFDKKKLFSLELFDSFSSFLLYWIVPSLLHTAYLLLPNIPILIVAGSISGLSFHRCIQGCLFIYVCGLFCRMIGFFSYCVFGSWELLSFFVLRIVILFFLIVTAVETSIMNPFLHLYNICRGGLKSFSRYSDPYAIFLLSILILLCISVPLQYMAVRFRRKKVQRP